MTNKAPVSPNRGYSRMQHLWLTERIVDIVAHELELDPVEIRKRNYIRSDEMPYTTPTGACTTPVTMHAAWTMRCG